MIDFAHFQTFVRSLLEK